MFIWPYGKSRLADDSIWIEVEGALWLQTWSSPLSQHPDVEQLVKSGKNRQSDGMDGRCDIAGRLWINGLISIRKQGEAKFQPEGYLNIPWIFYIWNRAGARPHEGIHISVFIASHLIGRLRTFVDTTVMSGHIIHGWLIPSKCTVVEVTTIREGHELEDPNYPNE
jgi:hypothetical protein